jgi:hypothetical protein
LRYDDKTIEGMKKASENGDIDITKVTEPIWPAGSHEETK